MTEREVPESGRRYDAYSHEALKAEVETGNDPGAAGEIGEQWATLGTRLRESTEALGKIAERSEDHWQGTGGDALRGMLAKAAAWSGHATEVSFSVADAVTQQAGIAARAKDDMPAVVSYDPAQLIRDAAASGDLLALVGLSETMSARRDEAEAARAKAVDVMNARDAALRAAVPAQSFDPPPALGAS
ncbi:PE-PGRS family protein [Amycolatopsis anabasis]|uniref:PE-PGRS family protein n=1 Tax=Amycolatopsis anabasis TaxID=1840409 RepID=UPI00131EA6FA|nr:PE-PGRS family protein [Amycolatopsis anabasis]